MRTLPCPGILAPLRHILYCEAGLRSAHIVVNHYVPAKGSAPRLSCRRLSSGAEQLLASRSGTKRQALSESNGEAATSITQREDLKVVLVEPQIPPNAGNVARTCAATRTPLHIVGPVGFDLSSNKLRRAGLDYWPYVCVETHTSWSQFLVYFDSQPEPRRLVAYSKFSRQHYAVDGTYKAGDWLIFGAETHGLPVGAADEILERGGIIVKIPMDETFVRSLNLATSVGVGMYEAIRQLDKPCFGQPVSAQIDHMS